MLTVLKYTLLLSALFIMSANAGISGADDSCNAGWWLKGGVSCVPCRPGEYCPGPASRERLPRKCSPGWYSGWADTECTECPAGWACATPDARPSKCPAGFYSYKRATSCSMVPEGHYSEIDGSLGFCRGGHICEMNQDLAPRVCIAGSYCPNFTTETECDAGQYSRQGASACTQCPPGHKCPNKHHPPIACGPGTYSTGENNQACATCDAGYFCEGASHPMAYCPPGTFSRTAFKECIDCPAGFSCGDPAAWPVVCAEADYSLAGWEFCAPCPAGYFCEGSSAPAVCPDGYTSLEGDRYCAKCPVGHHCPRADMTPQRCEPGQWTPVAGSTVCTDCPAGSFCQEESNPVSVCPERTHSQFVKSAICTRTPQGYTTNSDHADVTKCAIGQITDKYNNVCFPCPQGYACPGSSWSMITPCPPGTSSVEGTLSCLMANPGSYMLEGRTFEVETNIVPGSGYFSDVGFTYQVKCYPGWDCTKDLSGRYNVICPPGRYYMHNLGCTICPAGSFCPIEIGGHRPAAIACQPGSYALQTGQTECRPCPPGFSCTTTHVTACDATDGAATYQPGGQETCKPCPEGFECTYLSTLAPCPPFFYSPESYANCLPCDEGQECIWKKEVGIYGTPPHDSGIAEDLVGDYWVKTDNVGCLDGYYSSHWDESCIASPKGHFAAAGDRVPTKCPGGTFASQIHIGASCPDCPDGYYSEIGSEYCTPVPQGFEINAADDGLTPCDQGTYADLGDEACTPCPDGFLCPPMTGEWGLSMFSCPRGSWCTGGVETKCPAGAFGTRERGWTLNGWTLKESSGGSGETACDTCPPGFNCPEGTPDYNLHPCPQGAYCLRGDPMVKCPLGSYRAETHGRSLSDCQLCPQGFKCDEGQKDRGTPCPEAYYCGVGAAQLCPPGTHGAYRTGKVSPDQCLPCPPGHYCPLGLAIPAPAGKYTSIVGLAFELQLSNCPPGFYCSGTGNALYKGRHCHPGYYCPAGTAEGNETPCPAGTWSDRIDLHDASHCSPCPAGYRCAPGSNTSTNSGSITGCPEHSFCPSGTASTDDAFCPAGTYSPYRDAKSMVDCISCPAGSYCLSDGAGPQGCPTGHYCPPGTRSPTQYPCPPGTFNAAGGGTFPQSCLRCGLNRYCPGYGNFAPTTCSDGYYVNLITNAEICNMCPAGYYCDHSHENAPNPEPCPAGLYSIQGATQMIPGTSAVSCEYCLVGHYCPFPGTSKHEMIMNRCPEGTYCNMQRAGGSVGDGLNTQPSKEEPCEEHASGYCTNGSACDVDKYCPLGTTVQLDIPPGMVQRTIARGLLSEALAMPAGYWELSMGNPCAAGKYCPPGTDAEIDCPAGTYRDDTHGKDVSDCGLCISGTYCPKPGTSQPLPCGYGKFCPEGSIFESDCPRGTYNEVLGLYDSRECTPCDAGHYCPQNGQIFDPKERSSEFCCDPGFICYSGSERPEPTDTVKGDYCPVGGYCPGYAANNGMWDEGGLFELSDGDVGFLAVADDPYICYTAVVGCVPGKFGLYKGAQQIEECTTCWPGFYCQGVAGADAIKKCQAGVYCTGSIETQVVLGENDPDVAAYGNMLFDWYLGVIADDIDFTNTAAMYVADPQTALVISPIQGYYCGEQCQEPLSCPIGYHSPQQGSSECTACPAGKWCPFAATASDAALGNDMIDCPAGFWCSTLVLDTLQLELLNEENDCRDGFGSGCWDDTLWAYEQHACVKGTYNPNALMGEITKCEDCPAGKACNQEGMGDASTIPLCAAGFFCATASTTTHPYAESTLFGPCPSGHFCEEGTEALTDDQKCPAGTYSNQERAISEDYCLPCPPGWLCQSAGLTTSLAECSFGYMCSTNVPSDCGSPGKYCPLNSHLELICPSGYYQSNEKKAVCMECQAGQYCMGGNTAPCPEGYYCP